ncbi:MAG TPA: hypothetical protein VK663_07845 [Burkholderiales bacterium]|nr:hypothetical protein [Burkholderiales bacterium]
MKSKLLYLATIFALAAGQAAAADVGVSINIGDPGFYGRLDIGNFPQPQLVYTKPVVIRPAGRAVYEPVYLRVPPGHARDWRHHCGSYGLCDRPVYFVQDRWYHDVYAPRYRERYRDRDEHRGQGYGKGHGKGRDRD